MKALGDQYFAKAAFNSELYEESHRMASQAFTTALSLSEGGEAASLERKLEEIEIAFIHRTGAFEETSVHARALLAEPSPCVLLGIDLAADFLERTKKTRQAKDLRGLDSYLQRDHLGPIQWKAVKQILRDIRALCTYVHERYINGRQDLLQPSLHRDSELLLLACLKKAGLISSEVQTIEGIVFLNRDFSTQQLQKLLGSLIEELTAGVFLESLLLHGRPPCRYALLVSGSLARDEPSLCSDLDLVLLIEEDSFETRRYFSRVGEFFQLRIFHLGESEWKLEDLSYLRSRFGIDIGGLNLSKMTTTVAAVNLPQRIEGQILDIQAGYGIEALFNGLRHVRLLQGDSELLERYWED